MTGDRLRVVTWNLWWRFGDWRRRQEAITAVLAAERPDLVGLQEVWTAEGGNQVELIARDLDMHWVVAPSPAPGRWQQRLGDCTVGVANAVLSRWPITAPGVLVLPAAAGQVPERTLLSTRIQAPGGPVPFATTHLESAPHESATRCAQVRAITGALAASTEGGHPPVLTGDLNAELGSQELRLLGGHETASGAGLALLDAWLHGDRQDAGWTWDALNPHAARHGPFSARVDYVFVGPPRAGGRGGVREVRVIGDRPVDGIWPSDHASVLTDLTPQEAPQHSTDTRSWSHPNRPT